MGKNRTKPIKSIGTSTVAYSLEEIHSDGDHMGSGTISQDFIGDDLVGISKVKIVLFETGNRGYVQRFSQLVVQKTVGQSYVVVILKVMESELGIQVCHRTSITFKPLKENGRLYFQFTVLVLGYAVARIYIVISKGIRFKNRIETLQIFIEDIGCVHTEIKLAIAI